MLAKRILCLLTTGSMLAAGDHTLQHVIEPGVAISHDTCDALSQVLPEQVHPGHNDEHLAGPRYWSKQQQELTPACRFFPEDATDVQRAITILAAHNTTIAIACGGHSSVIGASNIEGGVTIDLSWLSQIEYVPSDDEDKLGAVWLGPGARWGDVYAFLEPHNVTVSGGRVYDVGVGGYILGGGFSWFANTYGWTCDSVLAFEVVTSRGDIVLAYENSHAALFWALKGSLGAFGIVTRILVPAIRDRKVYGGALSYDEDQLPLLFAELEDLGGEYATFDPDTQGYLSFAWMGEDTWNGNSMYMVDIAGKGLESGSSVSPLIERFKNIPHIGSSMRSTTIRNTAEEIGSSNLKGMRRSKFTLIAKCEADAMSIVYDTSRHAVMGRKFIAREMLGATLQPITTQHQKHGNGVFDLPGDEPLLLVSVELWWEAADADANQAWMQDLHDKLKQKLQEAGALDPFVYPNYAATWQNPFHELSDASKERLVHVQEGYDPDDVWTRLIPGIWHL